MAKLTCIPMRASEALASIVPLVVMRETMRQTSFKQHLLWLLRCKQRRLCRWLADASFGIRARNNCRLLALRF